MNVISTEMSERPRYVICRSGLSWFLYKSLNHQNFLLFVLMEILSLMLFISLLPPLASHLGTYVRLILFLAFPVLLSTCTVNNQQTPEFCCHYGGRYDMCKSHLPIYQFSKSFRVTPSFQLLFAMISVCIDFK